MRVVIAQKCLLYANAVYYLLGCRSLKFLEAYVKRSQFDRTDFRGLKFDSNEQASYRSTLTTTSRSDRRTLKRPLQRILLIFDVLLPVASFLTIVVTEVQISQWDIEEIVVEEYQKEKHVMQRISGFFLFFLIWWSMLWAVQRSHAFSLGNSLTRNGSFLVNASNGPGSPVQQRLHQTSNMDSSISFSNPEDESVSVRKIIKFAVPAVGIWLCAPLLSVIDTSAVGLFSGTVQQGALNPAVTVTDYTGQCMSFLYTATTNLIAVASKGDPTSKASSSKDTLVGALRVSLRVGICMGAFLLLLGDPMLRGLIGKGSSSTNVLISARKYVWIRALGMPAAAMIGSTQAACLGMQDTFSPLITTLLAASVNLVADIVLVRQENAWLGGVAGAAWATILSQYVAISCYLLWLNGNKLPGERLWKYSKVQVRRLKQSMHIPSKQTRKARESIKSVRGILKYRMRRRDLFLRRPGERSSASDFLPYVVPVTTTQVGRCSVYVAMGIVVSSMDVTNMAANQIITAFFYALIPVADSLSQTAQALLPPLFASMDRENFERLRVALINFTKAAMMCGASLVGMVALIPTITKFAMTSDPAVQAIVNSVVPIHLLIFIFHGIFCASEGILLAQKDLSFLGKMYGVYFLVVPTMILQLSRFGSSLSLQSVWLSFLAYQGFRISTWVARVSYLYRKRKRKILE